MIIGAAIISNQKNKNQKNNFVVIKRGKKLRDNVYQDSSSPQSENHLLCQCLLSCTLNNFWFKNQTSCLAETGFSKHGPIKRKRSVSVFVKVISNLINNMTLIKILFERILFFF